MHREKWGGERSTMRAAAGFKWSVKTLPDTVCPRHTKRQQSGLVHLHGNIRIRSDVDVRVDKARFVSTRLGVEAQAVLVHGACGRAGRVVAR